MVGENNGTYDMTCVIRFDDAFWASRSGERKGNRLVQVQGNNLFHTILNLEIVGNENKYILAREKVCVTLPLNHNFAHILQQDWTYSLCRIRHVDWARETKSFGKVW